ncbi:Putative cytolethal distending toxin nuclease subunit CdtB [Bacteriophage APSE-7]|nr:Putative cytolethal distending toxin nuclease subunit CdtB [Bacteriophage APSE-7]
MSKEILKYLYATVFPCLMMSICSSYAAPYRPAHEFNTATWNMQGSHTQDGFNKWDEVKGALLGTPDRPLEIMTLQESGTPPESANEIPCPMLTNLQPEDPSSVAPGRGSMFTISAFEWNLGTLSRPNMVYIYQASMSNRLNLAIVSRYQAHELFLLPPIPPEHPTRRPILGIRINESAFFNIHAGAIGGANEAPMHVINIENTMLHHPDVSSWVILGDFNRSPRSLINSDLFRDHPTNNHFTRQVVYDRTETPTQQSGNILDYAIVGANHHIPRILAIATLMHLVNSDHYGGLNVRPCG